MIKKIINLRSTTITFSASLIAFSVGVSAILGLLRDRILIRYAHMHLEGMISIDIYFAAFRIPDFIYGILITGGIVAAFLPVFSTTLKEKKEKGWDLANNTFNVLLLSLIFLCTVLFIFTPYIMKLIAPGFSTAELSQTVFLTRLMLLSPIILGVSSLFSGILQYFDRFLAYSLAPIFYNVGIIFGIIFFTPQFGITGLAYGVILGSLLHLFIQIPPSISSGFSYKPFLNLKQKELRKIVYLIIPRIIGQASSKINIIVITALASLLTAGSISIFNFANHLQSFPVRVIGVAFAIAAFPAFSKSLASKEQNKFLNSFSSVVRQVLFLIIPISVIVFLLRAYIVRLVLGVEGFGWWETQLTAASLGIFSFSFFAAALVHVLVRVFFSFQDTRTPVIASLISMGSNIALSFLFVWLLGFDNFFRFFLAEALKIGGIIDIRVIAFPLALLISSLIHLILLTYFLKKKTGKFENMKIRSCLEKSLFGSFVMGVAIILTLRIAGNVFPLDTFFSVLIQSIIAVTIAFLTYIGVTKTLKSPELEIIYNSFFKKK